MANKGVINPGIDFSTVAGLKNNWEDIKCFNGEEIIELNPVDIQKVEVKSGKSSRSDNQNTKGEENKVEVAGSKEEKISTSISSWQESFGALKATSLNNLSYF